MGQRTSGVRLVLVTVAFVLSGCAGVPPAGELGSRQRRGWRLPSDVAREEPRDVGSHAG